jgi:hypothetical protein
MNALDFQKSEGCRSQDLDGHLLRLVERAQVLPSRDPAAAQPSYLNESERRVR